MKTLRQDPPRARRAGFSLIEVMIAMTILAFGLLGMALMQIHALQQGTRGRHTTSAAQIARDQYEQILRMPYSGGDLSVSNAWQNPSWINIAGYQPGEIPVQVETAAGQQITEHVFRVWYRVLGDAGGNPDLRNIDLELTRSEDGVPNLQPTRTGMPTVALSGVIVNNDL